MLRTRKCCRQSAYFPDGPLHCQVQSLPSCSCKKRMEPTKLLGGVNFVTKYCLIIHSLPFKLLLHSRFKPKWAIPIFKSQIQILLSCTDIWGLYIFQPQFRQQGHTVKSCSGRPSHIVCTQLRLSQFELGLFREKIELGLFREKIATNYGACTRCLFQPCTHIMALHCTVTAQYLYR